MHIFMNVHYFFYIKMNLFDIIYDEKITVC